MKRGWIALAMIALSLVLGGIEYIYVTSNADAYVKMLDDADEKIAHNLVYEAESAAERLDNRFRKQSGIFNIFMYHSEMEHISCDLAMLRRSCDLRLCQAGNPCNTRPKGSEMGKHFLT